MNASRLSRATSSWTWVGGDFMKYWHAGSTGPPMPRSSASLAQRTASMMTPAELGESCTSSLSSTVSGTSPKLRPSRRMKAHLRSSSHGTWSDGPMWTSLSLMPDSIWLVTDWVLDFFLDLSRDRSSMFMKSMFPPKFSWYVWSIVVPRSSNRRARVRCTMVAPTWDLMSSPTIGMPASRNLAAQEGSEAMNTGMAFTKATPASRQAWA